MPKGTQEYDLIVIGGGPAGLAAIINGASEGLKTLLIDSGPTLGGQAAQSSLIENYPGFSEGVAGEELIRQCVGQARKFGAKIECPLTAIGLRHEGTRRIITTEDGLVHTGRTVILSAGLSYRRLDAENLGGFIGQGAFYGVPAKDSAAYRDKTVCVVGGANSAGQAAMHLAKSGKISIKLLIRKRIEDQMSQYLVERIRAQRNIEVLEGVQVSRVDGKQTLEEVIVFDSAKSEQVSIPAQFLFIFIGAQPKTLWLRGDIAMDDRNFILTGSMLIENKDWKDNDRLPLTFETSMPGVFACGDVRAGSTKRIASASGEGSVALQLCHTYLGILNGS
jgi:thioredoxin reductase (NADPH)